MTQNYDFFVDSPSLSYIFEKRNESIRRYQVWLWIRYINNGQFHVSQTKEASAYFGISKGYFRKIINVLIKEKLVQKKQKGWHIAIGKYRFAERFGRLGSKKFNVTEELLKDKEKFRNYLTTVQMELYAMKYGSKINPITGEIINPKRKENRERAETEAKKDRGEVEQSMTFMKPCQSMSSNYISKCLSISPATANRHVRKAAKNDFLSVQKNLNFVTTQTVEKDGQLFENDFKGTWIEANRFLKFLQDEYKGYSRYFPCKRTYDTGKKDAQGNRLMSGYWGIACLDASTLTFSIEYMRTGMKYTQYQKDELEFKRTIQHYKCR